MYSIYKLITYARNRYNLDIPDIITCKLMKAFVSEYIKDFLPDNLSAEEFFSKYNIYFHKWNNWPSSHYVYCDNGVYFYIENGDRGENYAITNSIKSKYLDNIYFYLFWIIAFYLDSYYKRHKLKPIKESKFELFQAMLEKTQLRC
ncbi:MAG: hypothetical protein IJ566_01620 [Cardiobacteriaceae bacterium]|nr:hypothetical protein [Cardiobacteriaceae bacterium]